MNMEEVVNWWKNATVEQREEFLYFIGSYPVSDTTWYVHPKEEAKPDWRFQKNA